MNNAFPVIIVGLLLVCTVFMYEHKHYYQLEDYGRTENLVQVDKNIVNIHKGGNSRNYVMNFFGRDYLLTNGNVFPYLVQEVKLVRVPIVDRYWLIAVGSPASLKSSQSILVLAGIADGKKEEADSMEYWQQIKNFYKDEPL